LEGVDDERRQILEEAAELDHMWGVWEVEKEPTNGPCMWIRQPFQSKDDMKHHVEVHTSHREIGPLFRTAGHVVRTQHGVTASAGQRRGDVEVRSYLRDAAGSRSLVFDLSITHDRIGSSCHVQQNGSLSHKQDLDAPLRMAAQRKINSYRQQYADNQNIPFLPAIMTTSSRMQGEFLRLRFLQAHRETTAHFHATGLPSQQNRSHNTFRFKRAAFYVGLKSKVGLVAAKASALRINLNTQGCSAVTSSLHAPSHAPLLPLLLSHNIPLPRVH
jgi:hypothetical protein